MHGEHEAGHAPRLRAASPRCRGCGAPTALPRFAPVRARCLSCRKSSDVELVTEGGLRQVELGLGALFKQRAWLDALERRAREGFVIVDACGCEGPLVVAASESLGGLCDHCGLEQEWRVGEHVVDALPASRIEDSTWGGGLALRFVPSLIEATVDAPSPCVGCGAPLPAFRGMQRCAHCRRTFPALLSCGRRFLVGFDVTGDDEGRQVSGWLPIGDAVAGYRARRELLSRSRWSTLHGIGAWTLLILVFPLCACPTLLMTGVIAMSLPRELERLAPGVLIGGFGLLALVIVGAFGWLIVRRLSKHARDREELLGHLAPLPRRGTITASAVEDPEPAVHPLLRHRDGTGRTR